MPSRKRRPEMVSEKKECEDLEDILDEMEQDGEPGDVTVGLRRAFASRIRNALQRHDTDLMLKCMQAAFDQTSEQELRHTL